MVGELEDRDPGEIDLLPAREFEQQVERPLEPVDVDRERRLARPRARPRMRLSWRTTPQPKSPSFPWRQTMALRFGAGKALAFGDPQRGRRACLKPALLTKLIKVNKGFLRPKRCYRLPFRCFPLD